MDETSNLLPALGVDIGGVLISHGDDDSDTSFFSEEFLRTPPVPGVFDALAALHRVYDGRVSLVSKAHRRTEWRTRQWLQHYDLQGRTGLSPYDLWFTQDRAEKAKIATLLGLTAFVDDRLDVLEAMPKVALRVLLDVDGEQPDPVGQPITRVLSWEQALPVLSDGAGPVPT